MIDMITLTCTVQCTSTKGTSMKVYVHSAFI